MEQDKEYTGIWLPRHVLESKKLTDFEKLLYCEVRGFNFCYETNETIARKLSKEVNTVSKAVNKLIKLGYIEFLEFNGRRRVMRALADEKFNGLESPASDLNHSLHGIKIIGSIGLESESASDLNPTINKIENKDKININSDVQFVYDFYIKSFKKNKMKYKLSPTRINKIKARLKDAGKEMLLLAIEKTSKSQFHLGANDRKWKADLDFIIRNYEQVERLSNLDIGGNLKYDNRPKQPIPKPVEREIEVSPEEARKNIIVLDLVRKKEITFSDMKAYKSKPIEELEAMLKSV